MNIIRPQIFKSLKSVEAIFTGANREFVNSDKPVSGLNLGYNTGSSREDVDQNFKRLFEELKWDNHFFAIARQVHHNRIRHVNQPGIYDDTDGLITNTPELAIGIRVADCAAVILADPENRLVGVFHAGWKGAVAGIVPKGVKMMAEIGADPSQIHCYISACISLKNFEVGPDVAKQFPSQFVDSTTYTKPHVDLKGYVLHQLIQKGIPPENIECSNACTVSDASWYSYRRDGERAGRMIAMIKLNQSVSL